VKKLVLIAEESIFSGVVKCGMAELVDSLANSLGQNYEVTVVCPDGDGVLAKTVSDIRTIEYGVKSCRFSCVDYYMIKPNMWPDKAIDVVNRLKPDIFHNMSEPWLINMLSSRPPKAIYTFDYAEFVDGKEDSLAYYDAITVNSKSYAGNMMKMRSSLSSALSSMNFKGITSGILNTVFDPKKGLLLPMKYSPDDQSGKQICKQRLLQTYGISGNPYICLLMCGLVEEKGIDDVLNVVEDIKNSGGVLLVVGKGDAKYEKRFKEFKRSDGVVYLDKWASHLQIAPLTSGADFFLQPSIYEACGLMPMTASCYGAIPIVTLNGGLADNFNEENAIIVDNGLTEAIHKAASLYMDSDALIQKRKICMEQDFSWNTRKAEYIELYEE